MKICMVGAGYVGLVSGTCFAEMGHEVTCVDVNAAKIEGLNKGVIPIYEPGLEELVKRNVAENRLSFTTSLAEAAKDSLFVFIAVGTPPGEDGSADLQYVLSVACEVGQLMTSYKVIVNKSTVPVGTAELVQKAVREELQKRSLGHLEFDVVSNPEFLKEGDAIADFLRPDRIVVGVENPRTAELMKELYGAFVRNGHPIHIMDVKSSELTKYAANAMLATRISFMNELSQLCDTVGADIEEVRKGIGSDSRIGMPFLYAGLGYGGSCFPKDVQALQRTMKQFKLKGHILNAVEQVNKEQRQYFIERILKRHDGNLKGKQVGIWGLSFKPKTDDMREAPSIDIVKALTQAGAVCVCHCPEGTENAKPLLPTANVKFVDDIYSAAEGSDLIVLVTEWSQFRNPNWEKLSGLVRYKELWDGRNQYTPSRRRAEGWEYHCIGRGRAIER